MSKEVYIFEATDASFEELVIQNSDKLPVVALFLGVWSEHCFVLIEIFSKLAKEFAGQFIFVKIDIDENQALKERYKIENVPTVKLFHKKNEVLATEGLMDESEARILLKGVQVFHISDAMREQARKKHMDGDTNGAIVLLSEAIQQDPSNVRVALDMVQIFIDISEYDQANDLMAKLPESAKQSDMGKALTGQLTFINFAKDLPSIEDLSEQLKANNENNEARFNLALRLTAEYQYQEAIDHLLDIQKQDSDYREGAAKEMLVTLINMLKPNHPEEAKRAQLRLSNLLSE